MVVEVEEEFLQGFAKYLEDDYVENERGGEAAKRGRAQGVSSPLTLSLLI